MLILGWITETFISIGLWIVGGIYRLAAYAFEIFLILATGQLLDPKSYELLIKNFYILLGVILLFFLAFSLLRGMVNPDDQKQGTSVVKNVIINLITSAIILAILPSIFAFAFDFQDSVIMNKNVIGRFFGYGASENNDDKGTYFEQIKHGAYQIVNGVYTAFLNVNEEYCNSNNWNYEECGFHIKTDKLSYFGNIENDSFEGFKSGIEKNGYFTSYGAFSDNVDNNQLDFNFLLSIVAGALLIYIAVSYCFDMALRLVKLVFYQLIAPIPIFLRVIPNGKLSDTFGKWVKITLTCYLEVYIRIFVFYFVIYLCQEMIKSDFWKAATNWGFFTSLLIKAFILMGIITFMKQAPKLFSEITGIDSGNMKLGIKDKLAAGGAFTAGAVLGGGAAALARNATGAWLATHEKGQDGKFHRKAGVSRGQVARSMLKSGFAGGISGAFRGGKAGLNAKSGADMKKAARSGAQGAVDAHTKRANYKAAHGGTVGGAFVSHVKDKISAVESWAGYKNPEQMKRENYAMDLITNARDKFDNDADALLEKEMAKGSTELDYGTGTINLEELANMKRELDNARANGSVTKEMEDAYNDAKRNARFKLQNATLISNKNWDSLSNGVKAKLAALRTDAVNYKGEIRNNAALSPLADNGINGIDFADDRDYELGVLKTVEVKSKEPIYEDRVIEYEEEIPSSFVDNNGKPTMMKVKKTKTEKVQTGEREIVKTKQIMDDNDTIDKMNKGIKVAKGENNIAIAQREQQKYEENSKK